MSVESKMSKSMKCRGQGTTTPYTTGKMFASSTPWVNHSKAVHIVHENNIHRMKWRITAVVHNRSKSMLQLNTPSPAPLKSLSADGASVEGGCRSTGPRSPQGAGPAHPEKARVSQQNLQGQCPLKTPRDVQGGTLWHGRQRSLVLF